MKEKYLITIIDDSYPNNDPNIDLEIIHYSIIKKFIQNDNEWSELSLKHFIKKLLKRAELISNVEIVGFYTIPSFIEAISSKKMKTPNILIIDWDFGTSCKTSEYLAQVLKISTCVDYLYIFSRPENMMEITQCLILPENISSKIPIFLYDKGKKEHEQGATLERLIDRSLRKVENVDGRTFNYEGKEILFYKSVYLNHYLDFWKILEIAGKDLTFKILEKNSMTLNENVIKQVFLKVNRLFYTDENLKYLFLDNLEIYQNKFGNILSLSAFEALEKFGLHNIELVIEKSSVKL